MLQTCLPRALAIVILAALASSACSPKGLEVRVTALRDPARTGRTYWLVPGLEGLSPDRIEYRGVEALVDKALRARGYQRVDRSTEPHLVILLGYGVGPPQTIVQTNRRPFVYRTDRSTYHGPLPGLGGVGHTSTTTDYAVGSATKTEVFTVYTSWIRLSAVDGKAFAASRAAAEVWTTTAYTDARGRDLQGLLPALLASAMDHFGTRTPREVRVRVPPESQRVEWLIGAGS